MSKAGLPGALAASAEDGAAATCQRVCATLGPGSAASRMRSGVVPDVSAASASRRVAVRSRLPGMPQSSIRTAPSAVQRTASSAARNPSSGRRTRTWMIWAGSSPKAASPGMNKGPASLSEKPWRIQTILPASPEMQCARPAQKPVSAAASAACAANISCRAPRAKAPSRLRSTGPASRGMARLDLSPRPAGGARASIRCCNWFSVGFMGNHWVIVMFIFCSHYKPTRRQSQSCRRKPRLDACPGRRADPG